MTNFENYNKPIQIEKIEKMLFSIGFNRKDPIFMKGIFNFTYDNWIIIIEHKKRDMISEEISFEIFQLTYQTLNLYSKQSNYHNIKDILVHKFSDFDNDYINNFNIFKDKVISLLKELFKKEIRKMKISNLLN